ncbi:hypothetical protein BO79DRAFT_60083 [Aspergillus costaricaensis CBS 115574]|uniref:Uncharacterized protein n=1 Tax=Aspergillus costaricaensis CBS 115574 TaxID=1448317 RepID=A0ACD1I2V4_9EURO|nr:hypothetical protein BO79DRAFT_60083 [Aspergillus costaricaensis CBS 115574]RAK84085.1 hypothetical protein BO79DRAFT_60083 [Aspergillus costaricaensis CBS 115574]
MVSSPADCHSLFPLSLFISYYYYSLLSIFFPLLFSLSAFPSLLFLLLSSSSSSPLFIFFSLRPFSFSSLSSPSLIACRTSL